jgi:6-pyruvoyltetrahydropterin/6-carboxytetrahydropterin synthase
MYRICVIKEFASAHNLRGYKGNCENLHGHNFKAEVFLEGEELDTSGMLVDFRVLKDHLASIIDNLDHKYLNETPPFNRINPTSENIAQHIFNELKRSFPGKVSNVRVWESKNAFAEYSE